LGGLVDVAGRCVVARKAKRYPGLSTFSQFATGNLHLYSLKGPPAKDAGNGKPPHMSVKECLRFFTRRHDYFCCPSGEDLLRYALQLPEDHRRRCDRGTENETAASASGWVKNTEPIRPRHGATPLFDEPPPCQTNQPPLPHHEGGVNKTGTNAAQSGSLRSTKPSLSLSMPSAQSVDVYFSAAGR